ncbi:MAG TPA: NADH-quinone oxidoreductase subunit L [Planctomycetota bacterium]|nr:NADH-quinone oxidoreductase subunit L [Planctomycetota bacterium]
MNDLFWILPLAITGLPLLSALAILLAGHRLERHCDKLAVASVLASFCMSVALFSASTTLPQPVITSVPWITAGGIELHAGILVDGLSSFMSLIVTGLATLVLVYSVFYMHGDPGYGRYFGYMSFFCFAMLGLVFSSNLLLTFVFWELVGLGSYFLIGFWFARPAAAEDAEYQRLKNPNAAGIDERYLSPAYAQKKAFVMNRIGDAAFLIGIAIFATVLAESTGASLTFNTMYDAVERGAFSSASVFGLSGSSLLTLAGICVFIGAMGKSAQFPLHTWLADAMQGPTTGSAIIHAATMVAAGVYLMARMHPLLTSDTLFVVSIVGATTAIIAATIAMVQWDVKAVLAYSTISQLGYMMAGLGAGAAGYSAGIAHLFTHAIFKCLLFLCAGSVIHACHHLQDMHRMGGLRKKLPLTHGAMLVGTLAISGVPLFSGFYSKDAILEASLRQALERGGVYWLPTVLVIAAAALTAFYMFRLLFMTFYGVPRDADVYESAHESPATAIVPLIILSVFCVGFWWNGGWIEGLMRSPAAGETSVDSSVHMLAVGISLLMLVLGGGTAWLMYIKSAVSPKKLLAFTPLRAFHTLFIQLWFIDRIHQNGVVPAVKRVGRALWRFDASVLDRIFVDGWALLLRGISVVARAIDNWVVDKLVDAFGWAAWTAGTVARALQAGQIQYYVCVTLGMAAMVLLGILMVQ